MKPQDDQNLSEQYQDRIRELEAEVQKYKLLFEFLYPQSHELRTRLSPIIGFTRLLLETTSLTEKQLEYANKVLTYSYYLLNDVNNLADFNKLFAGKFELEKSPTNLRSLLDEVIKEPTIKSAEINLRIILSIEPRVPEIVLIDGWRVKRLIAEIINQVAGYRTEGQAELSLSLIQSESSPMLHFEVLDTRFHFSSEQLKYFTAFFGDAQFSPHRIEGVYVSIGLMMTKMLCDYMQGKIWVEEPADKGRVFHLAIPYEPT